MARKPIKKRESIQRHDDFMKETNKLIDNEDYRTTYLKRLKRAEEAAKPKPKTKER